jgi:1-acyl-sn-glycerol-3-phosphate acyltransferase
MMLRWLRRRQDARRLAQADAEALIRDHVAEAYREARERERNVVILPDGTTHAGRTPAHWRRVALIIARKAGTRIGIDTATWMRGRDDTD